MRVLSIVNYYFCCTKLLFLFFAVPFDEDERDRSVWFLDHNYLESMAAMFKKVNCKFSIMEGEGNLLISTVLLIKKNLKTNKLPVWP